MLKGFRGSVFEIIKLSKNKIDYPGLIQDDYGTTASQLQYHQQPRRRFGRWDIQQSVAPGGGASECLYFCWMANGNLTWIKKMPACRKDGSSGISIMIRHTGRAALRNSLPKEKEQSNHPAWQDKVVSWYEREFPMPDRSQLSPQSMLQLTFGACGYETRVWLNGQPLSTVEGEEVHVGEYTSFSYEINEESLQLVNRLTVRIADTMDADIPRGQTGIVCV